MAFRKPANVLAAGNSFPSGCNRGDDVDANLLGDFQLPRKKSTGAWAWFTEPTAKIHFTVSRDQVVTAGVDVDRGSLKRFRQEPKRQPGLAASEHRPVFAVGCEIVAFTFTAMQFIDGMRDGQA